MVRPEPASCWSITVDTARHLAIPGLGPNVVFVLTLVISMALLASR